MLYHAYEMTHAAISPMRSAARMSREMLLSPFNPFAETYGARTSAAMCEMFISATRRYGKPDWGLDETVVGGETVPVRQEVVLQLPFCDLIRFVREGEAVEARRDPKVLVIAPMSGHYATLLRGTVKAMLPEHDVYVTDWIDAREVPVTEGHFDLEDYTEYLIEFCQFLAAEGDGARPAVMAVCQPGVPMLVAASLMAMDEDPARPSSVTLMGSPIDTACNPKKPNELAMQNPLSWFERNVVLTVPWPNKGFLRRVYPGFLQLSGFMAMNLDRHTDAHVQHFTNLVRGDGESTASHRRFYDEYMAVMDLTAEFYLQTIERVFQKRLLATGRYRHRDLAVEPAAIRDIALLTIEGEKDDITGLGQTEAAHRLVTGLPDAMRAHYVQARVGHYGVFNGSRWRGEIQPRVRDFIRAHAAGGERRRPVLASVGTA
ncbi:polyhydroxyalkanoate depolymerase [Halovulum dunhuangense]|uniref:Polyhydroxyalkanoate depolymerase n=1 Tax=Halovulum dunhuangense TaxID=1505036 RepID=A0A849KQ38_9RHOB|nr:polyhydroxyalkanoate depolymerase [Halovulum dunhuangense]NNU78939.1 polyhydroxyalkanoate depolymerase [Halovulum dunhuangense]